jgi:hypothetical protein
MINAPTPPPLYPRQSPWRSLVLMASLAMVVLGGMWWLR